MSEELKPCPFCECVNVEVIPAYVVGYYMAVCDKCNSSSYSEDSVEKAIAAWNTRPLEDALRAELAAKDAEIATLNAEKLECIKSLEYFVNRMQEERTERIRLEERLKMAEATVKFMAEDSGYDNEEASDGQAH